MNNEIIIDGFKMTLDERSYMDISLFLQYLKDGTYEKEISQYVKSSLKPGDTFIDIGANSGYYSLLASIIVGDDGMVLAFEPYPETFNRLIKNLNLNGTDNVRAYNMALSSYDGKGMLNVSRSSDGLNSMKAIPLIKYSVEIEVRKLDTVLEFKKDVKMIKIDAEGSELDIIKGASRIIAESKDLKIIFEINNKSQESQSIIDKLSTLGFSSFTLANGELSRRVSNTNEIPVGIGNLVSLRE